MNIFSAKGIHGILCDACNTDHGKARSGQYIECNERWKEIIFAILISVWSAILVAIMMKSAMSITKNKRYNDSASNGFSAGQSQRLFPSRSWPRGKDPDLVN